MLLKITECEGMYGGEALLRDLAVYKTVDKLVDAVATGKSAYRPHDFAVTIDGERFVIMSYDGVQDGAKACVNRLKSLGKARRDIVNDTMSITADIFEGELFIEV